MAHNIDSDYVSNLRIYVQKAGKSEEKEALEEFGEAYSRYMAEVPGFIPHLK